MRVVQSEVVPPATLSVVVYNRQKSEAVRRAAIERTVNEYRQKKGCWPSTRRVAGEVGVSVGLAFEVMKSMGKPERCQGV